MNKKTDTRLTVADAAIGGKVKTAGRRGIKRTAPNPSADGKDLLKLAAAVRGQLDIADAGPSKIERASMAIQHQMEGDLTDSDAIVLAQYIRDRGIIGEDEVFAGIANFAEAAARKDPELNRLFQASEAKHKEAGFGEDEEWPEDSRPADVQALFDAYWDRFLQLRVAILRRHGEDEMADLLMNDPDAFQDRVDRGQKIFEERKEGK